MRLASSAGSMRPKSRCRERLPTPRSCADRPAAASTFFSCAGRGGRAVGVVAQLDDEPVRRPRTLAPRRQRRGQPDQESACDPLRKPMSPNARSARPAPRAGPATARRPPAAAPPASPGRARRRRHRCCGGAPVTLTSTVCEPVAPVLSVTVSVTMKLPPAVGVAEAERRVRADQRRDDAAAADQRPVVAGDAAPGHHRRLRRGERERACRPPAATASTSMRTIGSLRRRRHRRRRVEHAGAAGGGGAVALDLVACWSGARQAGRAGAPRREGARRRAAASAAPRRATDPGRTDSISAAVPATSGAEKLVPSVALKASV